MSRQCGKVLAVTEPLAITAAEADVFDRVTGEKINFATRSPGPRRPQPVSAFQLLSLLYRFASEAGLPGVATDDDLTMLNYGFDDIRWHGPVFPGESVRDEVALVRIEEKHPDRFLITHSHKLSVTGREDVALTGVALGLAVLL